MSEVAPNRPRDPWPFTGPAPALVADPIAQGAILTVVASALFLLWPGIDVWFTGLFFGPAGGFPMARLGAFRLLRELAGWLVLVPVVAMAVVVGLKLALPTRPSLLRPRDMLFVFSTLAIGPGIIVNVIFKANWGRPRPIQIEPFGGDAPFVGVWEMTDHCARNCSFISGEASSALWTVTLAMFLPARWRAPFVAIVLGLTVLLSLNRIAFGGHFLSDVVISWGITLTVIAILHRVLYVHPPAALTDDRLEAGLTAAGLALRGKRG